MDIFIREKFWEQSRGAVEKFISIQYFLYLYGCDIVMFTNENPNPMFKKALLLILINAIALTLSAQYSTLNTIPWNNNSLYNPAATAIDFKQRATIGTALDNNTLYGRPWSSSTYALYNYRLDKINSGVGLSYSFHNSDFSTSRHFIFNYAYHLHFKDEQILSFGASFSFDRSTINFSKIDYWGIDPLPPYPTEDLSYDILGGSLGAAYKSKNFFIGFNVNAFDGPYQSWNESFNYTLNASYDFTLGNNFKLTPAVYTYFALKKLQYLDLNFKTTFRDRYWIGAAFGFNHYISSGTFAGRSMGAFAGMDIKKKYRIGYSFRHVSLFEHYNVNELVFSLMIK